MHWCLSPSRCALYILEGRRRERQHRSQCSTFKLSCRTSYSNETFQGSQCVEHRKGPPQWGLETPTSSPPTSLLLRHWFSSTQFENIETQSSLPSFYRWPISAKRGVSGTWPLLPSPKFNAFPSTLCCLWIEGMVAGFHFTVFKKLNSQLPRHKFLLGLVSHILSWHSTFIPATSGDNDKQHIIDTCWVK